MSLTLIEGKRAWTAATSGPVALGLDGTQYGTTSGPCIDAARYGETIKVTMDGPDQPYPDFRQAARREGVSHTMSVGFSTGDQVMGAMNIYNSTGRPFGDDSDRIARAFAVCAGIVLANVERYRLAAARASHLEIALLSRAPIEQAKGILMTRHRCTSEEAFTMLLGLSQNQNVKLRSHRPGCRGPGQLSQWRFLAQPSRQPGRVDLMTSSWRHPSDRLRERRGCLGEHHDVRAVLIPVPNDGDDRQQPRRSG